MAEEEKNSKAAENSQEQENLGSKEAAAGGEKPEAEAATESREKEISKDARMWAMFSHLAGLAGLNYFLPLVGSIVGPLILWQLKKDEYPYVNEHGKEAVNFQISIVIYTIVACILIPFCIGAFLLIGVIVFDVVFILIAAIKANNSEFFRYPLTIRFIK